MIGNYPLPKPRQRPKHLSMVVSNPQPLHEFGKDIEDFEGRIFRNASHFNVVRFGTHNGSEIKTVDTFPKALAEVGDNPRALIYAVTSEGRAFCVPKSQFMRYSEVWLLMKKAQS